MNDIITQLAIDIDEFEYDYDYYGYVDAFEDRNQAREILRQELIDDKGWKEIIEYLTEIVSEHDEEWETRAQELIDRIKETQLSMKMSRMPKQYSKKKKSFLFPGGTSRPLFFMIKNK